jgi:hypothetical protein
MPDNTPLLQPDYNNSPEKQAFIIAEQGTLEVIELMGAADCLKYAGRDYLQSEAMYCRVLEQ